MANLIFILSTGRTGTQFFESYINETEGDALCLHEPKPSRRFKFLSNLYLNNKTTSTKIIRSFRKARKKILTEGPSRTYIESNNFMFGCIPALNESYDGIKIIHIIRHPVSYVISHLNHGFWRGHKKFFARFVPHWIESLNVKKPYNPVELLAERWNYVNKHIAEYEGSNEYLLVRFEDLFSKDPEASSELLNQIRTFCGLPVLGLENNSKWLSSPKNTSRKKYTLSDKDEELIRERCSTLMKHYHYS